MAKWLIVNQGQVDRFWSRLPTQPLVDQEAYKIALEVLGESPRKVDHAAGAIKHLKGKVDGCNHEYRKLPNAQRIYYKIYTRAETNAAADDLGKPVPWEDDDQLGVLIFYFTGPHPKERARSGSGRN